MGKKEAESRLKDVVTAMHKFSRRDELLCPSSPAETLSFYVCSSPHPKELIDYAEVNEEYKVKGHDHRYAVSKQGASLNDTVKSSSAHMGARAIPEGKQTLWEHVCVQGEGSHFTLDCCQFFLLPQLRHHFLLHQFKSHLNKEDYHFYQLLWVTSPPFFFFFLSLNYLIC